MMKIRINRMRNKNSSESKFLIEIFNFIKKETILSEAAENEIISAFGSRGEKAVRVLKEKKLLKLVLTEEIELWEVEGTRKNYLIIDNNFCECKDFQIRSLSRGTNIMCYHLLAKMIGEKISSYVEKTIKSDDYDLLLKKITNDKKNKVKK